MDVCPRKNMPYIPTQCKRAPLRRAVVVLVPAWAGAGTDVVGVQGVI
jgi:hypothetical protein